MPIANPLHVSEWGNRGFLGAVIAAHLAMWGSIGWSHTGIELPYIRQLIGFMYLTFVPGTVLLRVLRIHSAGTTATVLYTVGLSIAAIFIVGLFVNTVYPVFGIADPISEISLATTMSILLLALSFLSCSRDVDASCKRTFNLSSLFSPQSLVLITILVLTVSGAILFNHTGNSFITVLTLFAISLIILMVGFDVFIPTRFYSIVILVASVSLLLHTSLVSDHLWGSDDQVEHYLSAVVVSQGFWDSGIPQNTNGMLSIVMLAPVYSLICNLDLTWVYKIIYPLLFSLVPLGLYSVFRRQVGPKIAALSLFLFMGFFLFSEEMLTLARQEIAELFLVLTVLLVFDDNLHIGKKAPMLILFSFSLVVSHYGLSYIFMAFLVLVVVAQWLGFMKKLPSEPRSCISGTYVALYILILLGWYIYVSSSSSFNTGLDILSWIGGSFFTGFMSSGQSQGLAQITAPPSSYMLSAEKLMHLFVQTMISLGVVLSLRGRGQYGFRRELLLFALSSFLLMLAGIAVPYVAGALNTSRLYQIGLIFLSPFFVVGCLAIHNLNRGARRPELARVSVDRRMKPLSVFLVVFFLFNTGLVYQLTGDTRDRGSISLDANVDTPRYNNQEFVGAEWLVAVKDNNTIFADQYRWQLFASFYWQAAQQFPWDVNETPKDCYLYLGSQNIMRHSYIVATPPGTALIKSEYVSYDSILTGNDRLYDNGGAWVYLNHQNS
jgi:uncharacterized membrane protein